MTTAYLSTRISQNPLITKSLWRGWDFSWSNIFRIVFRIAFVALFLFELANVIRILNYEVVYTWPGLVLTSGATLLVIELVNRALKQRGVQSLPWFVWGLAFASILVDTLGDIAGYYASIPGYDKGAHFLGGVTATVVLLSIILPLLERRMSLPAPTVHGLSLMLAYAFTALAGTYYEIEEYVEDLFTGSHRSGGSSDTAADILMNTLGSTLVIVVIYVSHRVRTLLKRRDVLPL